MNITDLPRDMLLYEMFPKMMLPEMLELSRNKATYGVVVEYLSNFVTKWLLPYTPRELMEFGHEYPFAIPFFISAILDKMYVGSRLINVIKDLSYYEYQEWDYDDLTANPNISIDDINNTNMLWTTDGISARPELNIKWVQKGRWNWKFVSANPGIFMKDIESNPTLRWDYQYISKNPNLTISFVKNHLKENWDWKEISKNPGITFEDVLNNPKFPWKYLELMENPNVTPIDIKENPMKEFFSYSSGFFASQWNYDFLGFNLNFSIYDIPLFPKLKEWNIKYGKNFSLKDIYSLPGRKGWKPETHPDLTMDMVKKQKGAVKEYQRNPVFTLDDLRNSGLPIEEHKSEYSYNPTVTNEEIEKDEVIWNRKVLSKNKFIKDPDYQFLIYRDLYRKFIPEKVTLRVNDHEIEVDKEFAYGFLVTIKTLKLEEFFTVDYLRSISNSDTILVINLVPDNYQMFTVNTARQPYMVKIRGKPLHFSHINFLNGVKSVYDSVKLPFDIKFYYDKTKNYEKILVE